MTKRKFLISVAIVLLLCVTACQVYYFGKRRLPAISGQVLDMKTSQPIVGADVGACYLGPMRSLVAPARPIPIGGGGTAKTDAQGRFSFPASWLHVGSPLDFLIGPQEKTGIWMLVYSKDYVTCLSASSGFNWKKDKSLLFYKDIRVDRKKRLLNGFKYTIRTTRAESEEEWKEKANFTLKLSTRLPRQLADSWVFNDLTGYLQRWPDGKKAGVYIMKLVDLGLAMYEPFWDSPISNPAQRKKCLAAEQTILKWVDSRPVEQITSNPLEQKVLPKERQIISDAITQMLEQDTNNFSGGKNAD